MTSNTADPDNNQPSINIDDINIQFGGQHPPKDEELMSILKDAYQAKIKCRRAVVKLDLIQPFSDFKPEISSKFRADFLKGYLNLKPPELFVYQKEDKFIMSDDYSSYYMYKEVQAETALCVILGSFTDNPDIVAGPEFNLDPPTVEVAE